MRFVVTGGQTPMRTSLPIARAPAGKLLVDPTGGPVWPIAGPRERAELASLSKLFGGKELEVEASAPEKPRPGEGRVLAIGDVGDEARLYAHLTGRRLDMVDSPRDLGPELPDVIVLKDLRLDCDLVQMLCLASYGNQAPGIIWGRTHEELRRQVLVKSAAAFLNGPVAVRRVEQWSLDGSLKVSPQAIAQLRERVGQGAGVLTIFAHSDGVGQRLGSGAALCGRLSAEGGDSSRGPQCLENEFCHRLDRPVQEALGNGLLIGPMEMSARVLINTGCHSGFLGTDAVDSAWAPLPGFVNNPRIGALVVNPTLSFLLSGPMQKELAKYLEIGMPVGRALVRFEENSDIRDLGFRMLLFGDPGIRAAPPAGPAIVQRDADAARRRSQTTAAKAFVPNSDPTLAQLEVVRLIAQTTRADTRERGSITSRDLVECIGRHEDALAALGKENAEASTGASLRAAVFQHLATTKVRLFEAWQKVATLRQLDEARSCIHCGWRAFPREAALPAGDLRLLFICPRCSDVMDVPLQDDSLGVSMSTSTIALMRRLPADRCAGAIFAVRFSARDTKMIPWPIDDEEKLSCRVDLTEHDLPAGPIRVYAVIAEGMAIHSIGAWMRIEPTRSVKA